MRRIHASPANGFLVSKPGYDPLTATAAQLLLGASGKYSNLLKLGLVDASGSVVLGFGAAPYVSLTSISDVYGMPNVTWPADSEGPMRPSPIYGVSAGNTYATVTSDGASMSVVLAGSYRAWYAVYSRIIG